MQRVDREPCPFRIVDDAGGAFIFGLIGGTVWYGVGGARNAPSGHRISQAISRIQARTPMLGGGFAVWGVLFSCCDCTISYVRKKEDLWNPILSGALTGGILASRAGLSAAGKNALAGGVILAAIEGLNIFVVRVVVPYFEKQQNGAQTKQDELLPPIDIYKSSSKSSTRKYSPPNLWSMVNSNSVDTFSSTSSSSTTGSSPSGSSSNIELKLGSNSSTESQSIIPPADQTSGNDKKVASQGWRLW